MSTSVETAPEVSPSTDLPPDPDDDLTHYVCRPCTGRPTVSKPVVALCGYSETLTLESWGDGLPMCPRCRAVVARQVPPHCAEKG